MGADGSYPWAEMVAGGQLEGLTIPELKEYLKLKNLRMTGKKQELIDRITAHVNLGV